MIREIEIHNYKSIQKCEVSLSNVNVFIGANGSGKSNLLEAIAMFSASMRVRFSYSDMLDKGVRIAKPTLTVGNFLGKKQNSGVLLRLVYKKDEAAEIEIMSICKPQEMDNIYSDWVETTPNLLESLIEEIQKEADKQKAKGKELSENFKNFNETVQKIRDDKESKQPIVDFLSNYQIYTVDTPALRGITSNSKGKVIGLNGEGLDTLLERLDKKSISNINERLGKIEWFEELILDTKDVLKVDGYKLGHSISRLYFVDKYMQKKQNLFSAENVNEGILHLLFYYAVLMSKDTPKIFGVDNIDNSLNPKLCTTMMKEVAELAIENNKQILATTHNPAILDGLNLNDDRQRLFVVYRNEDGHTKIRRIKLKPEQSIDGTPRLKLSEMWTRGLLGGTPQNF